MSATDELEGFRAAVEDIINPAGGADNGGVTLVSINGVPVMGKRRGRPKKEKAEGEENALEDRMFKLRKRIGLELSAELDSMNEEALRERISQCECHILESEKAKAADEELKAMREKVKEANAPYADVKKMQRAIAEYSACALDKRGVA